LVQENYLVNRIHWAAAYPDVGPGCETEAFHPGVEPCACGGVGQGWVARVAADLLAEDFAPDAGLVAGSLVAAAAGSIPEAAVAEVLNCVAVVPVLGSGLMAEVGLEFLDPAVAVVLGLTS